MSETTTSLCAALRANADLTEKALDFMADPEQIEEAKADIALWRSAADRLERLDAALEELLDVAERIRGGDTKLNPEQWYATRDYVRVVLKSNEVAASPRPEKRDDLVNREGE